MTYPSAEVTPRTDDLRPPAGVPQTPQVRRSGIVGTIVLAAVPPVALVVGLLSLRTSSASDIGPYGLIQALRPAYFAALALLALGFVGFLLAGAARKWWVGALYVGALTVLLDGAAYIVEGTARFPVTYVHAGFTEAIMRTGVTLTGLDARFSWPGFFSMFGYLSEASGLRGTMPLALWFPLLVKLLWLAALWLILRTLLKSYPAAWLGVWMFEVMEWSGQSYFSPQALDFFLYLVCVLVLLVAFDPVRPRSPVFRTLLVVTVAAYTASVVSHQLTPFMFITVTGVLALFGLTRTRSLWILLTVIFVTWFSFATEDYWVGHLAQLFGGAGDLGATVNDNVGGRVLGSVSHERVIFARMALSLLVWALAGVGVLVAWRKKRLDARLVVLGAAPFLSLLLQSYGGEGLIRVFLFALPASAGAAALLFVSARSRPGRAVAALALGALLLALIPFSLLAKYGGESYEAASHSELRAGSWIHRHTRTDDLVASIAPEGTLRWLGVGQVDFVTMQHQFVAVGRWQVRNSKSAPSTPRYQDQFVAGGISGVRDLMLAHTGRRYLVLTPSQYAYGTYVAGFQPGWEARALRYLATSPDFRLVYRDGPSVVYELKADGNG